MSKRYNRHKRKEMAKKKLEDCKRNLIFYRNETIRLRKMLKDVSSQKIQNLGKFELIPDDGKSIPLKVKEDVEVKV